MDNKEIVADKPKKVHTLSIDNRARGVISGVEKVISSNDKLLQLVTADGTLVIRGDNFRIKKYSMEEGVLSFEGDIDSMLYTTTSSGKGVIKKLFR